MTLNEFLNKCSESYSNISLFDKLFSSPFPFMIKLILYVLSAFILVCIGGFSGLRGWYLLTILFAFSVLFHFCTSFISNVYSRSCSSKQAIPIGILTCHELPIFVFFPSNLMCIIVFILKYILIYKHFGKGL